MVKITKTEDTRFLAIHNCISHCAIYLKGDFSQYCSVYIPLLLESVSVNVDIKMLDQDDPNKKKDEGLFTMDI